MISYLEMCRREGTNIQAGMDFWVRRGPLGHPYVHPSNNLQSGSDSDSLETVVCP